MLPAIITERQAEIDALCREYRVRRLELFGSAATGDWDAARSDLDFLVRFDSGSCWTAQFDLAEALQRLFERDVDLVADQEFENPYFRQSVEDSRTHLWGECRQAPGGNGVRVSSHRALKYLWDIQQEVQYLLNFADTSSLDDLMSSEHFIRSVPQSLIRIGEAINTLSQADEAVAERISDYGGYVRQRNFLVHQYTRIDWDKVWNTVTVEVPVLAKEVAALIAELDPEARRS